MCSVFTVLSFPLLTLKAPTQVSKNHHISTVHCSQSVDSMWSCSHIDSSRRNKKKLVKARLLTKAPTLIGQLLRPSLTFPTEVCWATQRIIAHRVLTHFPPYCPHKQTYHLRTFSIAARTFLMSSLARLRVSARPDRPDILMLLWFMYRRLSVKTSRPSPSASYQCQSRETS